METPPKKRVKTDGESNILKDTNSNEIFKGINGYFLEQGIGKGRCNVLQKQFQNYGGIVKKHFKDETTHIFVKGDLQWEKILKFLKVKTIKSHVLVVDVEWLSRCLVSGEKLDMESYLLKDIQTAETEQQIGVTTPASSTSTKPTNHELFELRYQIISDIDEVSVTQDESVTKNEQQSPEKTLQKKSGFWACAAPSTSKPVNLNEHITDKLEILEKSYETTQDQWRARAYKKAIKAIKNHPTKLTSYEEVAALPFVGERLAKKIKEIIETGHLRRLDHIDPKVKILELFSKVWGAGPKTAEQWLAQGYKTLEDLAGHPNLTCQQKIGLKYYDDINERMPRDEVAEIETHIRAIAEKLLPDVLLVVCGSYRRGRATCGDIDILVSHKDNKSHIGFLLKLLDQLKSENLITNDLISVAKEEQRKYMGLIKLPGDQRKHRRIDFIVAPYDEWACALMHFTGSAHFNRSIRLLAKKKNMSLSEHALRINVIRSSIKGEEKLNKGDIVTTHTEEDIFKYFGLDYLKPTERDW